MKCDCNQTENLALAAASAVFKALGHPVRLHIVRMLLDGERCVCELHKGTQRDMSTISSHLNILKNAGVVASEQRGKNIFYTLAKPCLRTVVACLCN